MQRSSTIIILLILISNFLLFIMLTVLLLNQLKIKEMDTDLEVLVKETIVESMPISYNQKLPFTNIGQFELSFYCPCEKCVGKKKIVRTASGTKPKANYTIAVDTRIIPLGSILYIEGFGYFIAQDTGSAIKGNRIDIFVDSHQQALKLGRKKANVYLLKKGQKGENR